MAHTSGFVYAVSLTGVTGAPLDTDDPRLQRDLTSLRTATDLPIAVGFGVRTPEAVHNLARLADGVIVGSALVEAGQRGADDLSQLIRDLRAATHA